MFSIITMGCYCNRSDSTHFKRGTAQNIASTIDILSGVVLLAIGLSSQNCLMVMGGSFQMWPLFAFITLVILSRKQDLVHEPIYVKFSPCSGEDNNKSM